MPDVFHQPNYKTVTLLPRIYIFNKLNITGTHSKDCLLSMSNSEILQENKFYNSLFS